MREPLLSLSHVPKASQNQGYGEGLGSGSVSTAREKGPEEEKALDPRDKKRGFSPKETTKALLRKIETEMQGGAP